MFFTSIKSILKVHQKSQANSIIGYKKRQLVYFTSINNF
jgi:hypothetical protein